MVSWSVQALSWRIQFKFLRRFVNILNACVSKKTWTPKNGCLEDPFSIPQALFFLFQCESPYMYFQLFKPLQLVRVPTCISSLLPVNPPRVSHGISVQTGRTSNAGDAANAKRSSRSSRRRLSVQGIFVLPTQTGCHVWGENPLKLPYPNKGFFF